VVANSTDPPRRVRKAAAKKIPARPQEPLVIDSHSALLRRRKAMLNALTSEPGRARLLFANPVLAFRDAGVVVSPAIADHILHSLQHPPEVKTQRERLTELLRKALGSAPHPSDPGWLATTVFTQLKVGPLDTAGLEPTYLPAIPEDAQKNLRALLPPRTRPRLPARPTTPAKQALWRIDIGAEVPERPPAKRIPKRLALEQLWFYLPRHDLIRPMLELGIIERSTMPVLSAAAFRKVRSGEQTNGLVDWIQDVSFPATARKPADRAGRPTPPDPAAPPKGPGS